MKVIVTVVSTDGRIPVEGARVVLSIDKRELAVLYSDTEGRIVHADSEAYIGQTLFCKAEKDGFHDRVVTQTIEVLEMQLGMELVPTTQSAVKQTGPSSPIEAVERELLVHLKDEQGRAVGGVTVTCEMRGFKIGSGVSDDHGTVRVILTRLEEE